MKRTLIPLLAVLAVAVAGVGYAAIPAANGTITACKDSKGALKVIDAENGQACNANQQQLTWNQQGPQGPPGQDAHIDYVNVTAAGGLMSGTVADVIVTHPQTGVYEFSAPRSLGVCRSWVTFAQSLRVYRIGNINGGAMLRVITYDVDGVLADAMLTLYLSC